MGLLNSISSEKLAEEHRRLVIALCFRKSAVNCGPSGAELVSLNNASLAACSLLTGRGLFQAGFAHKENHLDTVQWTLTHISLIPVTSFV